MLKFNYIIKFFIFFILFNLSLLLSLNTENKNQFISTISAQIKVEVSREFTVSNEGKMQVKETEKITNNFTDKYIPGSTERKYFFVISTKIKDERSQVANQIYQSLKLKLNSQEIEFNKITEGNDYGIKYQLRERINPNTTQTIEIHYHHPELAEKIGGLVDAYIPAFSDDFKFNLGSTNYVYRTTLKIPSNSGQENIVSIKPLNKYKEGNYDIYVFDQNSLKGKFVWIQRGSKQVYKFSMKQVVQKTQDQENGNLNEYQLILPRDIDEINISQKVYFSKIKPEPKAINKDNEGNIIGIFQLPAYQDHEIIIKGYAILQNKERKDITKAGQISDIHNLDQYLNEAEYWEVNHEKIDNKAKEITNSIEDSDNVSEVIRATYKDIVNSIDYSQTKRFGLNERQGALKTLNEDSAAVCMEYSDLYLTLLRNRGIPTKAAFGYGFDSRLKENEQEAHQWVQVYLPNYDNWIGVDVTWGESGTDIIGGDLNHFYTHLASENPNSPPVLSRLTLSKTDENLSSPEFVIKPMANLPKEIQDLINKKNNNEIFSINELLQKYPTKKNSQTEFFWDVIKNMFVLSWQKLITSPEKLLIEEWAIIGTTLLIGFAFSLVFLKILHSLKKSILNNRKKYKKKNSKKRKKN